MLLPLPLSLSLFLLFCSVVFCCFNAQNFSMKIAFIFFVFICPNDSSVERLFVSFASLIITRFLQFLPVPELMPFRLTRQFVNLMLPLKESGTLQNVMVHTIRALRNNHELVLNTMDVFIKEPSLDWQVCIDKLQVS